MFKIIKKSLVIYFILLVSVYTTQANNQIEITQEVFIASPDLENFQKILPTYYKEKQYYVPLGSKIRYKFTITNTTEKTIKEVQLAGVQNMLIDNLDIFDSKIKEQEISINGNKIQDISTTKEWINLDDFAPNTTRYFQIDYGLTNSHTILDSTDGYSSTKSTISHREIKWENSKYSNFSQNYSLYAMKTKIVPEFKIDSRLIDIDKINNKATYEIIVINNSEDRILAPKIQAIIRDTKESTYQKNSNILEQYLLSEIKIWKISETKEVELQNQNWCTNGYSQEGFCQTISANKVESVLNIKSALLNSNILSLEKNESLKIKLVAKLKAGADKNTKFCAIFRATDEAIKNLNKEALEANSQKSCSSYASTAGYKNETCECTTINDDLSSSKDPSLSIETIVTTKNDLTVQLNSKEKIPAETELQYSLIIKNTGTQPIKNLYIKNIYNKNKTLEKPKTPFVFIGIESTLFNDPFFKDDVSLSLSADDINLKKDETITIRYNTKTLSDLEPETIVKNYFTASTKISSKNIYATPKIKCEDSSDETSCTTQIIGTTDLIENDLIITSDVYLEKITNPIIENTNIPADTNLTYEITVKNNGKPLNNITFGNTFDSSILEIPLENSFTIQSSTSDILTTLSSANFILNKQASYFTVYNSKFKFNTGESLTLRYKTKISKSSSATNFCNNFTAQTNGGDYWAKPSPTSREKITNTNSLCHDIGILLDKSLIITTNVYNVATNVQIENNTTLPIDKDLRYEITVTNNGT